MAKLCRPHTIGVAIGTPPFFYDYCAKCAERKNNGLVKGDEGPLATNWRRRVNPWIDQKKLTDMRKQIEKRNLMPLARGRHG